MPGLSVAVILALLGSSPVVGGTSFESIVMLGSEIRPGALEGEGEMLADLGKVLRASTGAEVKWRVRRDEVDNLGIRHVFVQQWVTTPVGDALVAGSEIDCTMVLTASCESSPDDRRRIFE
jgi:hypothetical protein